jgi:NADPH:quinone reductase-like Zn-dependent oxidoreductase
MRVRASSLNYRDLMVLKGGGRGPTKLGVVPLSDGAGEVAAIGDGVMWVKLGDWVIGTFHPRWFGGPLSADYLTDRLGANLDGMLAEYAVLSEEALVPVPSHLSFEEAATLPCAAVTAWVALTRHRRVTAGDTVLTQGSGGVSVFAPQFARILGARVIATTSVGRARISTAAPSGSVTRSGRVSVVIRAPLHRSWPRPLVSKATRTPAKTPSPGRRKPIGFS